MEMMEMRVRKRQQEQQHTSHTTMVLLVHHREKHGAMTEGEMQSNRFHLNQTQRHLLWLHVRIEKLEI
jgi:hypothetical protein